MPTEAFIDRDFSATSAGVIAHARSILNEYARQGYDLSLRQLYYQFVARDLLPNSDRSYNRLGSIVSDARLAGYLDWDMIRDRGRVPVSNPHWADPAEFLSSVAPQFRVNLWETQDVYIEVMVEKQALEGVLIPTCRAEDVHFTANKGYSSSSAMYETGKRMRDAVLDGKSVHVLYLGDHDPSGIDMSRDVADRLLMFMCDGPSYQNAVQVEGRVNVEYRGPYAYFDLAGLLSYDMTDEWQDACDKHWAGRDPEFVLHRLALNYDQVQAFNPPPNPAKLTDSRVGNYIAKYGATSWELDALDPATLAGLVTTAIERLRDPDKWDHTVAEQNSGRSVLIDYARAYRTRRNQTSDEEDDA